ncbi:UBP1-associated protein 2C [Ricinus communis]|uniref:UBP1-associated protein 2C n=1 Tax=Ricinus communis TaxID=3988 RepID=UPI00201A4CCD|nr:UBP1-associated protein 2C [Ricinus communis]XP_015576914.2 UBP1-associated protein 2C [Ricinus communis]
MDFTKKRKADENGTTTITTTSSPPPTTTLSPQDIRKIIEPFTKEQLLEILQTAATRHADVLESVRTLADSDISLRKLFIRGLSSETTTETIRNLFNNYGELEEAIVIFDKNTGKSKGFGFITFKHVDGALIALKEPSKKIDGRMTVTQLASAGLSNSSINSSGGGSDVSARKIYVGNVPYNIPSERLLGFFLNYGEVEEGPLGFDKSTGKSKGFAFIIYKTEEGAKAAIADPVKMIDGHQVVCKMAVANNKKVKTHGSSGENNVQVQSQPQPQPLPQQQPQSSMSGNQYGVAPANMQHYGGYSGNGYGLNASAPVGGGGAGYSGGPYGYGGGPNSAEFGGLNNAAGNSMYRMNPSSGGMASGGYPDGAAYGLSQPHQPSALLPRVPPGGMYQGMPPYY